MDASLERFLGEGEGRRSLAHIKSCRVASSELFELNGLRLRGDQVKAIEAWIRSGRRGQIVMPTGAGKTVVALAAMKAQSRRTLIVVPSRELVAQWREKIRRLLGDRVGEFTGDRVERLWAERVVTTYHSAHKILSKPNGFDMVVFDECHHLNAPTWGRLLELSGDRMIMGLTATPEEIEGLPVVYSMDVGEAMEIGAVSRVEAYHIWVPLNRAIAPNVLAIVKKIEDLRRSLARVEDEEAKHEIMRSLARLWQSLRMLLELTPEKREAVKAVLEKDEPEKGLIFVETISACETLARELGSMGYHAYPYHSKQRKEVRKALLEKLKAGKAVIVAAKALDEGIDVPTVKHIIILSCPRKLRRLIQRTGRGMRPGETLKLYTISTPIAETQPPKWTKPKHITLNPRPKT